MKKKSSNIISAVSDAAGAIHFWRYTKNNEFDDDKIFDFQKNKAASIFVNTENDDVFEISNKNLTRNYSGVSKLSWSADCFSDASNNFENMQRRLLMIGDFSGTVKISDVRWQET